MIEDSALLLKKSYDQGEKLDAKKIQKMLENSELVKKLLDPPKRPPKTFAGLRNYMWRLLELSEIPYIQTLDKVQEWLNLLVKKSFISEGFTLEGKKDNLVACHSAMITTILMRMEYADKQKINAGIEWILKYQSVKRGQECTWEGKDLYTRWGGCMKKIPCFYGVIKSMKALSEYNIRYSGSQVLKSKLHQGLEYILEHNVYKRLSDGNPIEDAIILNFYPFTYKSNIIEILSLLKANDLMDDERCKDAIEILKKKKSKDGYWQADVSYMKSGWVEFDIPKKPGAWINYVIKSLISN